MKPKRRCIGCQRTLTAVNKTGVCYRCAAVWRCPVCSQVVPGKGRGLWCQSCLALARQITAAHAESASEGEPAAVMRGKLIQPVRAAVRALEAQQS